MKFLTEDFMLKNETAKKLYKIAKDKPIYDYHCHLTAKDIYEDKVFENIYEVWLNGDHYKWRGMRANAVAEEFITGDRTPKEKFLKWANTLPNTIGNPLFHWSALELKKYFGVEELLNDENAEEMWDKLNKYIEENKLSPRTFITNSNVTLVCTTDNPYDNLEYHEKLNADKTFKTKVVPGFRPDEIFDLGGKKFENFLTKMNEKFGEKITDYDKMIEQLYSCIEDFAKAGSKVSDHGIGVLQYSDYTDEEVKEIFAAALKGKKPTKEENAKYMTKVLTDLCKKYKELDFVFQIHFGAIRNNNGYYFDRLGPDTGFDSIADQENLSYNLNGILGNIAKHNCLPKTVLYNLNPSYNDIVGSCAANFQADGGVKSKVQFGTGWWFNDTKEGMIRQMKSLCDQGLIMNFVGMLTDSRSFMSYTRHEYFRRIFCNLIGELVEDGEIPNDEKLLAKLVNNVCYDNAEEYFAMELKNK